MARQRTAAPVGSRAVRVICQRFLQPTGRFRRRSLSLVVRPDSGSAWQERGWNSGDTIPIMAIWRILVCGRAFGDRAGMPGTTTLASLPCVEISESCLVCQYR